MDLPLLYQLQHADFQTLEAADFRVAVVDPDDSGLTAAEIGHLRDSQGKILYAYCSIGEAEDYRAYWHQAWTASPPDFLLGENPDWTGNFRVMFWDAAWQDIALARVDDVVAAGYDGIYLDIVDGYTVPEVIAAYPGSPAELRQEMVDLVVAISARAKHADPGFAIVPQNALGLLSAEDARPETGPNQPYLDAIDGIGVEDLWYDGDEPAPWTAGDLELIAIAQQAGKFVLATSYPTQPDRQRDFIEKAVAAGFIPFVADRELTGVVDPGNAAIPDLMARQGDSTFGTVYQQLPTQR